jgi:hypothetical protein
MIDAVLLELARLPDCEIAGKIAVDDVLGFDVLAINGEKIAEKRIADSGWRIADSSECF